ncbi:hypothetical protein B5F85_02420 [Olsenella sp. An293]|nr:hypothetical protein B5F85_02420 [Olsenella sp. An293]
MALARRTRRVVAIVVAALLALVVVGLGLAGNFLVDFALNPNAEVSMARSMREGGVGGLDYAEAPKFDEAYAAEAASWFEAEKRSVSHQASDGTVLLGWELDGANGDAYSDGHTWAVVCHGYIGEPADMAKYAYHFSQLGMSVLMPAARGHERNVDTGLIQMGWGDARDLLGWVDDIVARDPEARIILFGVSMGGAEVMMASGMSGLSENVSLIVEDCGYTSVWDEFVLQLDNVFGLPSFPILNVADAACLLRAGYTFEAASAVESLRSASVPMLFIHGDEDAFVPFSMLDECYDACASEQKEKLVVSGAGHGLAASTDPDLYWSTVDAFVAEHL